MDKSDEDDKAHAPRERYADAEPSAVAFGGIEGVAAPPPPMPEPEVSPANMACLRGPCRHYWELVTHVDAGNATGTFGDDGLREVTDVEVVGEEGEVELTYGDGFVQMPRQMNRACLVNPGYETELTGDCVYECSRWDPEDPRDPHLLARMMRRKEWLEANKELVEDDETILGDGPLFDGEDNDGHDSTSD